MSLSDERLQKYISKAVKTVERLEAASKHPNPEKYPKAELRTRLHHN